MKISRIYSKITARLAGFKKHPLTRNGVGSALFRYLFFNTIQTLYPKPRIYNFVNGLKFYAQKGDAGIVANIYYKLYDYEDSMFMMDHLKENDLFVDVGANVGHFSLLAAGISKANVMAFEPIPQTFAKLNKNVILNNLTDKIQTLNMGIGQENSFLNFTTTRDVMNSVALEHETNVIQVQVEKLDDALKFKKPVFLKIDVEGYEFFVLKGANDVLSSPSLKYIIIEFNFSVSKFGHTNQEILELLLSYDFAPVEYDVELKQIRPIAGYNTHKFNTIFIKKDSHKL